MTNSESESPPFDLKAHIQQGDVAPWWQQGRYKFAFDSVAGRYIVLGFYHTSRDAAGQAVLTAIQDHLGNAEESRADLFSRIIRSERLGDAQTSSRFFGATVYLGL